VAWLAPRQWTLRYARDPTNIRAAASSTASIIFVSGVQRLLQRFTDFLKPEDRAEGGAQIAMVNPDGSGFRELTAGPNNNGFPSMAPDGRRFVYRTFGPEGDGLRIMDIETGKIRPIAGGYDNFPLWSPRGDLIMFPRCRRAHLYDCRTAPAAATNRMATTRTWVVARRRIVFGGLDKLGARRPATDAPQPAARLVCVDGSGRADYR
jgi:hypothetical protein